MAAPVRGEESLSAGVGGAVEPAFRIEVVGVGPIALGVVRCGHVEIDAAAGGEEVGVWA